MIAISTNDLSFAVGTNVILDKVTFSLEENDKLGIIGVNGCGKSTLLRLLTGAAEPTSGEVYLSRGKTMGILTQDGAFDCENEEETVIERMYRSFPRLLEMEERLAVLEKSLSGGDERTIHDYSELNEKFVEAGGLEFRSRCASILARLGFDKLASAQPVATLSGGQRTRLALAVELARAGIEEEKLLDAVRRAYQNTKQ